MRFTKKIAVTGVAIIAAMVPTMTGAQAAAPGKVISSSATGSVWACQRLENTAYGPIYRVKVTFQRTPNGPRLAHTEVIRRYNSTEWSVVAQKTTDDWFYSVYVHDMNASAVLGDRVTTWIHDGIAPQDRRTFSPSTLPRCA